MKLWQLADDPDTYGVYALGWLVVSDDGEDELAGPFHTQGAALEWIESQTDDPDYDDDGNLKPGVDHEQ